jgi:threonine synthase
MSITPITLAPNLTKSLGIKNKIYLKREDLHPLGSHKGRSIPVMIETYLKRGIHDFVISSSGNAALAAAMYLKKYNQKSKKQPINLQILVGKNISPEKLKSIKKLTTKNILLTQTDNPKQTAFQIEKALPIIWLRQSTDNTALTGYETLAKELAKTKNLQMIFIPTSSGTTAEGLYRGFKKLKLKPQIHIVQTTACHSFITGNINTATSLAKAIVDKIAHRKKNILKIIKQTKGAGWIANDRQIKWAIKLLAKTEKIKISPNSALALVGLKQALEKKKKLVGSVVLLITGR